MHPERREPPPHRPPLALPPRHLLPRLRRERGDDPVDPVERGRVLLRVPTGPRFPRRGRTVAGDPDLVGPADAEALLDGAGVEEPAVVEPAEEVAEVAVRGVGRDEPERDAPLDGPVDELEGDLDLRELRDPSGDVGAAAAGLVVDPGVGEVEPRADRPVDGGGRPGPADDVLGRHERLAVRLRPEHAASLVGDADGVGPLLRERRVVDGKHTAGRGRRDEEPDPLA
ncbi:MAG: hypothetical protein WBA11_18725, partial [Rubrivirga sp.]